MNESFYDFLSKNKFMAIYPKTPGQQRDFFWGLHRFYFLINRQILF
jgi:hypothetical protein